MSASRAFRPLGQSLRPSFAIQNRIVIARGVRNASSGPAAGPARRFLSGTLLLASGAVFLAYHYDSRSMLHDKIAMPFIRMLDAETSHKMAITLLGNSWIRPTDKGVDGPELQAEVSWSSLDGRKMMRLLTCISYSACLSQTLSVWRLVSTKMEMLLMGYLISVSDTSRSEVLHRYLR